MGWDAIAVMAAFVIFLGTVVFKTLQDRKNKLRDVRLNYLIKTYRLLANATNRSSDKADRYWNDLEQAAADIQLLGTPQQIVILNAFIAEMTTKQTAGLDNLVNLLREDLRHELRLSQINTNVLWLRFNNINDGISPISKS